jgi:hypothetical protein
MTGGMMMSQGCQNTDHYQNAEMSKLTDSEGEYVPADDEFT